jgi:zinc and cadmium transporter
MTTLIWIIVSGIAMSCIALVGSVTLILSDSTLKKILLPLVAFAAGSLIGGAFFHMIPAAIDQMGNRIDVYLWIVAGFVLFLAMEQFLNWHHSHGGVEEEDTKQPLTFLILIADGIHNFVGGMFVAASFIADIHLGIVAWLAAAAHEVPQELGDFAVLVRGGWNKKSALLFNFVSALTFLFGGLVAYFASQQVEVDFLIPFAAGNFIYIAAADLIPEIKHGTHVKTNVLHFISFVAGIGILLAIKFCF